MPAILRSLSIAVSMVVFLATASPAMAGHTADPRTKNLHPKGHLPEPARFLDNNISSDLAFWGRLAFQGQYDGFKIIDISSPAKPREVVEYFCFGSQGDLTVWGNLLFRSIDRPQTTDDCHGENTAPGTPGFEGLHMFDISNPASPVLLKAIPTDCGSHTQTLVPDLANNRVLIYISVSGPAFFGPSPFGNNCQAEHNKFDIVEVPLDNPEAAAVMRTPCDGCGNGYGVFLGDPAEPAHPDAHSCHDIGAIQGSVNRATCAGNPENVVFDISDPANPQFLYSFTEPRVAALRQTPEHRGNWHSASFTWDGEVMIMGWEPGGGGQAECQASDPAETHTAFFFDTDTGRLLGEWTLPRKQSESENCTIHNYNVIPLRSGRDVLVAGHYQAGTWVVDFTNPARPRTIAWADPPSLGPGPFCSQTNPPGCELGGAWSTYWYNGFIYESDITEGLNIFLLSDKAKAGEIRLRYLNPQTQDFSL